MFVRHERHQANLIYPNPARPETHRYISNAFEWQPAVIGNSYNIVDNAIVVVLQQKLLRMSS